MNELENFVDKYHDLIVGDCPDCSGETYVKDDLYVYGKCPICKREDAFAYDLSKINDTPKFPTPAYCPLTNSSHEKALVRVVEKTDDDAFLVDKDFIQVLCSCGHIISSNEIK